MIRVQTYNESLKEDWNKFVVQANNSTLLHQRDYMDYHADRFKDASLLFYNDRNKLVALFPACISNNTPATIASHQGLTYGGLIIPPHTHTYIIEEVYDALISHYKTQGVQQLTITPIPYIYATCPCQEELYIINHKSGKLINRALSQTIKLSEPIETSSLRRRCIAKAKKNNLCIAEATKQQEWQIFYNILWDVLKNRHNTTPVHSFNELWLLHSKFPQHIRLFVAVRDLQIIAGSVVYLSKNVAHTQYLASSPSGFEIGALDLVIDFLIKTCQNAKYKYLDFGVSTERDGSLNHGLTLQKEGFGGHGVCYDTYSIEL